MELRRLSESGLIVGGAMLFGISGGSGCLETTTPGTGSGGDISTEILADGGGGDSVVNDTTVRDTDRPDAKPDSREDAVACWEPPANVQDLIGRPCRAEWEGQGLCRDDTTLVVKCANSSWVAATDPGDDFCWCDAPVDCAPETYFCGAVGYVGVSKANMARHGGHVLRQAA